MMRGPGLLRYFGLDIIQHDDYSIIIDGDEKLDAFEANSLTLVRRRELGSELNITEVKACPSLNSSVGWSGITGITASPF